MTAKTVIPLFTSAPQTTDSAFTHALAQFDSAIVYAVMVDSTRVLDLARVGRGRALLGLGQFVEAGLAVGAVSSDYVETGPFGAYSGGAELYGAFRFGGVAVSNLEGSTAMAFVAAGDPRLPLTVIGPSANGTPTITKYAPTTYATVIAPPIVLASKTEARLIQVEALLNRGSPTTNAWLDTLNALRRSAGLSDTTDPGNQGDRVNLLFHERAFWLFGTGRRLGDLRRLIAHYGRTANSVFPTGFTRTLNPYGTATSLPFSGSAEHVYNASITGCTSL